MNSLTHIDPALPPANNGPHARLRLRLLGPMAAWDATGRPALPRGRKTRGVLALLALTAPNPVPRTRITSLLWSTRAPAQARGSLRQSVHELQDLLAAIGGPRLQASREYLVLDRDGLWVDARDAIGHAVPKAHFLTDLNGLDPAFDRWLAEQRSSGGAPDSPRVEAANPRALRLGIMPPRALETGEFDPLSFGLAEEISAALARFRWIDCVGPASLVRLADAPREAAAAPGPAAPGPAEPTLPASAWDTLALDFLLEGTLRHVGTDTAPRIAVTVRLLDLRNAGALVWSRRFKRSARTLLELQDEMAGQIAAQIDPELMLRAGVSLAARAPVDPTAYELVLRAIPAIQRLDPAGFREAGEMLERAIAMAPDFAAAHAWLACWHLFLIGQGWSGDRAQAMRRAGELAERAVMLDPSDARSLAIAGHVRGFLYHKLDEAEALQERAMALNPNLPLALVFSGLAQSYRGAHEAALARIARYRELSPLDPHAFLFEMALLVPLYMTVQFARVAETGRRVLLLNPGFTSTHKILLAALGQLDRRDEAREVLARLLALEPDFSVATALARTPLQRPEDLTLYAEGLRRAGVRETTPAEMAAG